MDLYDSWVTEFLNPVKHTFIDVQSRTDTTGQLGPYDPLALIIFALDETT